MNVKRKPNAYWTYEKCKEEALKYDHRTKFQSGSAGAYKKAYMNGWLDDICSHMFSRQETKPCGYWTYEKCKEEASKYKNRQELKLHTRSVYEKAWRNRWLDDICSHMTYQEQKPCGYWTYEKCKEDALKYNLFKDYRENSKVSYESARRNDWLIEITSHMYKKEIIPHSYWTYEKCEEQVELYQSRSLLKKN